MILVEWFRGHASTQYPANISIFAFKYSIDFLKHNSLIWALTCAMALFQACIPNKDLVYLQKKNDSVLPVVQADSFHIQFKEYKVQFGDVLNIKVLSQDPLAVAAFNIDGQSQSTQMQQNVTSLYINGYTVDSKGYLHFPILGDLFVKDKTVTEISDLLNTAIDKYANNVTIKVKLVSYKVTVLGEVKVPGVHYIFNDRATVFEVLGYAGDLTDLANRHKLKLVRTSDQNVQVFNIDITDRNLITSRYYVLQPNDVLYVEPMKAKNFRLNLPAISLLVSSVTTLLVIINFVNK